MSVNPALITKFNDIARANGMPNTKSDVKELRIMATVTRCGCGNPGSHVGAVCPRGIVGKPQLLTYYHKNPIRRAWWALTQALKGKKA